MVEVLVMAPAEGETTGVVDPGKSTDVMRFGVLKLARFRRLKNLHAELQIQLSR